MDKRLAKRHKRQVARSKERIKISEPDVRTKEQIEADREASRGSGDMVSSVNTAMGSAPMGRSNRPPASGSAAKTSV